MTQADAPPTSPHKALPSRGSSSALTSALMKGALLVTSSLCALLTPRLSDAADGLMISATEEGHPTAQARPFGVLQVRYEHYTGEPASGLTGALEPFNGELASFNRLGESQHALLIPRARFGLRGALPQTSRRLNYVALIEFGQNSTTRSNAVSPLELSATVSYLPGARLRVGYFKLPTMEEIILSVPKALEFIQMSNTLTLLMNEHPTSGAALPEGGVYVGGASAYRDLGVQLFESLERGSWRLTYAAMLSNGAKSAQAQRDQKDLSARLELAYSWGGHRAKLRRKELKFALWRLQGSRSIEAQAPVSEEAPTTLWREYERVRQGLTLRVERSRWWAMFELVEGRGALLTGKSHDFTGARVTMKPTGEAWGAILQGGLRLKLDALQAEPTIHLSDHDQVLSHGEVALKGRYERYHQEVNVKASEAIWDTLTLGVEWRPIVKARLELNYELRWLNRPNAAQDSQRAAESLGDRVMAQATIMF